MERLISIDIKADFGFLRKPDTNDGISMSYNMLHKPSLLGIFGAIAGLGGYQKLGELPEYYLELNHLKVAVTPKGHQNGNFQKTTIIYTNTVGYANKDGNFIAYENTLIAPSYTVYAILNTDSLLYNHLENFRAEYIPYLGKNEFPLWWENFKTYDVKPFSYDYDFEIKSLFIKSQTISDRETPAAKKGFGLLLSPAGNSFFYFERLPTEFAEFKTKRGIEYQYKLSPFAFTNAKFKKEFQLDNLFELAKGEVIQLN